MSKYGNNKVIVDGIKFDSKLEARRYIELKLLEKAKIIKDLNLQVPFELIPSYKKNGKTIRAAKYIADFVYYDNEKEKQIIEDTKGFKTEEYKLKKKLFEYKYRDLEITEIYKDGVRK
jgi:hypothetical protein